LSAAGPLPSYGFSGSPRWSAPFWEHGYIASWVRQRSEVKAVPSPPAAWNVRLSPFLPPGTFFDATVILQPLILQYPPRQLAMWELSNDKDRNLMHIVQIQRKSSPAFWLVID
jgi:hypothetical protein